MDEAIRTAFREYIFSSSSVLTEAKILRMLLRIIVGFKNGVKKGERRCVYVLFSIETGSSVDRP